VWLLSREKNSGEIARDLLSYDKTSSVRPRKRGQHARAPQTYERAETVDSHVARDNAATKHSSGSSHHVELTAALHSNVPTILNSARMPRAWKRPVFMPISSLTVRRPSLSVTCLVALFHAHLALK